MEELKLRLINHNCIYEAESMCALFFPDVKTVSVSEGEADIEIEYDSGRRRVTTGLLSGQVSASAELNDEKGSYFGGSGEAFAKSLKFALKESFYKAAVSAGAEPPPWGILTGVRPSKPTAALLKKYGEYKALNILQNELFVREDKAKTAVRTAARALELQQKARGSEASLYISVPFCPSRCGYCSFVSRSTERQAHLLDAYLEQLYKETEYKLSRIKELGLRLVTLYVGGGTPAVLSAKQIKQLFDNISRRIPLDSFSEITFEAGRPDVISREKLRVLAEIPNIRISINPQTLSDATLERIGRRHTAEEFYRAYNDAAAAGLTAVNCDLIAGLPGETAEDFITTADALSALGPEDITVHTLSPKRSSGMYDGSRAGFDKNIKVNIGCIEEMVNYAYNKLEGAGYRPYYIYKQRRSAGNLENTGFTRGKDGCLYNIYMMEELHSVFGLGAGSVTKLIYGNDIKRIYNYKYPEEYIKDSEMEHRKAEIDVFFEGKQLF